MYLADVTIKSYIDQGLIEVRPKVQDEDIRLVGLRVHLAKDILVPEPGHVDLSAPSDLSYSAVDLSKDNYILEPGAFILASTVEAVKTSRKLITFLDGRSTIARFGLTIHVTAGVIDGNHDEPRTITLEIKNLGVHSVRLRGGDPVGQLLFAELSDEIQQKSQSQYAGQNGVTAPNIHFKTGVDS